MRPQCLVPMGEGYKLGLSISCKERGHEAADLWTVTSQGTASLCNGWSIARQESPVVVEAVGGQCQVVGVMPRPGRTWRAAGNTNALAPESVSSSLRERLITGS